VRIVHAALDGGINFVDTADMALAFTLAHQAVTSAIIGPRKIEQLEVRS